MKEAGELIAVFGTLLLGTGISKFRSKSDDVLPAIIVGTIALIVGVMLIYGGTRPIYIEQQKSVN